MRRIGVLSWTFLIACACSASPTSVLEQGPRFPDDEGVVTNITLERMQFDGERAYAIGANVESFGTQSHEPTRLLALEGKYVQVGLDGEEIAWVASIGIVVQTPTAAVLYTGVFERLDADTNRAVFADGTTLLLGGDVEAPQAGAEIVASIDAVAHEVVSLEAASSRSAPSP